MKKKLLSIIIPVYNGEKYIENCLASVDTFCDENVEILVIDDGSTDNTKNICSRFKNIKYYKNKNHGVSYSRNYGIKHATGKFLMFVDSDDLLVDNWYENVKTLLLNTDDDIIYLSQHVLDKKINKKDVIESIIGFYKKDIPFNMSSVWSKVYKADYIKKNHIKFPEEIINGEDLIFNIRAIANTNNYSFKNISIYKYRLNYFSVTHNYNSYFFKSNTLFIKCLISELKKIKLSNKLIEEYMNFCLLHSIEQFVYRISLITDKKIRTGLYVIFNDKIYSDYIESYHYLSKNKFFLNFMMEFLKKKKYGLAINMMKLKNIINKVRKTKLKTWELI